MKKIFHKCMSSKCAWFTVGKEYEEKDGFVYPYNGQAPYEVINGNLYSDWAEFCRIERDEPEPQTEWQALQAPIFEAHGFTWNKHVPGDPMPCAWDAQVHVYTKEGGGLATEAGIAKYWWWVDEEDETDIIGWRFAEEIKPATNWSDLELPAAPKIGDLVIAGAMVNGQPCFSAKVIEDSSPLEIVIPDVTDHRQMVAMDTAQPESAGEKAYRLKQQAKQEAEAQKEQAKAEQMAQAGEVFSREYGSLNDHRLGFGAR